MNGDLLQRTGDEPERLTLADVKSRRYEARNPSFTYRIRPEDAKRIEALAEAYQATRDEVARGLVMAALDLVEDNLLDLKFNRTVEVGTDAAGRRRNFVVVDVDWVPIYPEGENVIP